MTAGGLISRGTGGQAAVRIDGDALRRSTYWICTLATAFVFLSGGIAHLLQVPQVVEGISTHLGYPLYVVLLLGVWKVLGGVVVLLPRMPLIKEWAYAGMMFDLTGASVSHVAVGDDLRHVVVPLVIAVVVAGSWALRPDERRIRGTAVQSACCLV
jgi:uncharacterized membrane protein YphA (DoxX/SURF4 family)